jgi:hypothetical protein
MKYQMPDGSFVDGANHKEARDSYEAAKVPVAPPLVVMPLVPPVVTVTATVTPVDNFVGRSQTRFGVGEQINLGFVSAPPQLAAYFGGLEWRVKSGPATLNAPVPTNGTARLVMGETAGTVILELRTTGLAPVVKATKTLWVVEPSGAVIVQQGGTGLYHVQGTASAGFKGEIRLQPTDVSFYRCQFREGSAPIQASGSLSVQVAALAPTSESQGQSLAVQSELTSLAGARHPVMGTWVGLGLGNIATGCVAQGNDTIQSATIYPPFAAGTFDWDIHWLFRVIGSRTEKIFVTATHSEAMTATGQMTISKGGHSVTLQAAALTSTY